MKMIRWMFLAWLLIRAAPIMAADNPAPPPEQAPNAAVPEGSEKATPYGGTPDSILPYRKAQTPYRRLYTKAPANQVSREGSTDLTTLKSIPIGVFVPLGTSSGKQLINGVRLATEEANAVGGFHGVPFEIVLKNDNLLWGSAANALVELAEKDQVWAVIGSPDSTSTHVALRAALKVQLSIINVGGADPTLTETGIPWIVRLSVDDRQHGYRLAVLLFEELGLSRVAILRSSDRDGRFGVREFRDAARRLGKPVPLELQFLPGRENYLPQLERLQDGNLEAIALWANAEDGAGILRRFREYHLNQQVVGTDRLLSPEFLEAAGNAAEGLILTSSIDLKRKDAKWLEFRNKYTKEFGGEPGSFAAHAYDAGVLAVEAIRSAGLNRVRIQDYLASIRKREGLSGTILLDETSNNISKPLLFQVRNGQLVQYP